ncbi:hypothetical protein P7C70_g8599, partial [Phenoliferia sp. Uapishka_3]
MVQAVTPSSVNVFSAFSEQLQAAQSGKLPLLDEEDSLATRWAIICDSVLQSTITPFNQADVEAWSLERNTWGLVQAIYAERLSDARLESPDPFDEAIQNAYAPPLSVVQNIIGSSKQLGELSAIRDWLHSIPTSLNPAEIRRGYLTYTKNKLKQAKRTGGKPPQGLVSELDPDAVRRSGNVTLDSDDASYERALLRSLFEYVRAGSLDLAIDMCRQSDQSWRAASLSGGKLWWDQELGIGVEGEDGFGEEMEMNDKRAKGNLRRRLWKRMCREVAKAGPDVDPYERALYGSISGDVSSVLPVCTTWEDTLWVHINSLFESHIEVSLWTSPSGRYWTRGSVLPITSSSLDSEDPLFWPASQKKGIQAELEGIFEKLGSKGRGGPYHEAMKSLILGTTGELLDNFVRNMEGASAYMDPEEGARLYRFYAHLVLILRLFKQPVPRESSNMIISAYVQVLEANQQDESLIAFYASNLEEESAVDAYARFLATFGTESDVESRRLALLQAREHGLDLAKIAFKTVELTLDDTLTVSLPSSPLLPPHSPDTANFEQNLPPLDSHEIFDAYANLSTRENELIRSLEWLSFDISTFGACLAQANALVRHFLSTSLFPSSFSITKLTPSS